MDTLPSAVGEYVVVHVATPALPLSVHGLVPNVPFAAENVTCPVGVIAVPLSVSVTVAVHVTDPLIASDDGHESDVDVERPFTVRGENVPLLAA
jgi:hypothetical protein